MDKYRIDGEGTMFTDATDFVSFSYVGLDGAPIATSMMRRAFVAANLGDQYASLAAEGWTPAKVRHAVAVGDKMARTINAYADSRQYGGATYDALVDVSGLWNKFEIDPPGQPEANPVPEAVCMVPPDPSKTELIMTALKKRLKENDALVARLEAEMAEGTE